MNFWHLTFHFPDGGVYSNIVASVLWTTPSFFIGFIVGHLKMKKHTQNLHDEMKLHVSNVHKKSK